MRTACTPARDVFDGLAGNDTLFARDGSTDRLDGGPGRDRGRYDSSRDSVTRVEALA